jgi:predicted dehydrogenase
MSQPITAVLLGAGGRGFHSYAPYALEHPDELRFIAVAEPNPVRRERFAQTHNIPSELQFATWEDLLAKGKIADALLNCTQDQMHYPSTMAALDAGYDVLLEKPMAERLEHVVDLVQSAEKAGALLQVCHVLRYTEMFSTLHDILASGRIGDIITVEHRENVVFWHMAHSFVRGHWRNAGLSSPMILAKCCHDLDILYWNLGEPASRLQSFGSLMHLTAAHAPAGAKMRCTDGCDVDCKYDARLIYLDPEYTGWPVAAVTDDLTPAGRLRALEQGPYGRCVYHCDNDVVDHQTVNMEFAGGATVTLFMHGHAYEESRTMRYDGTKATLRAKFDYRTGWIEVHDHRTGSMEQITLPVGASGHGGGDFGIMRSFVRSVRGADQPLTGGRASLESHLMAFAAEESRLTNTVVDMAAYRARAETGGR